MKLFEDTDKVFNTNQAEDVCRYSNIVYSLRREIKNDIDAVVKYYDRHKTPDELCCLNSINWMNE